MQRLVIKICTVVIAAAATFPFGCASVVLVLPLDVALKLLGENTLLGSDSATLVVIPAITFLIRWVFEEGSSRWGVLPHEIYFGNEKKQSAQVRIVGQVLEQDGSLRHGFSCMADHIGRVDMGFQKWEGRERIAEGLGLWSDSWIARRWRTRGGS